MQQNLIFDAFAQLVDHTVRQARREGKYDEAIHEIKGRRVAITDDTELQPAIPGERGALTRITVSIKTTVSIENL